MVTRAEIAAVFEGIADIMQIRGDAPSKVRAYRWAARVLDTLQEDICLLHERNELTKIPGIGTSIVEKIRELIDTGRCEYYEELKASIPAGVLDLMSISGVGPSTAARLYRELNVDSLDALQQALDAQKLRNLKGMGKKTEEKISAGLEALLRYRQYKLMGHVLPPAQTVMNLLAGLEDVREVSLAGGLRRRTETVRDVEIVAACTSGARTQAEACYSIVSDALARMELIEAVDDGWTDSGGSARLMAPGLTGGVELHVKLTDPRDFGPALVYFTGSESHIAELNDLAARLGLEPLGPGASLTGQLENLKAGEPENQKSRPSAPVWARSKSEEGIYAALGLPFIVPELREGREEIQAALAGQLPRLIDSGDIRGDLHVHSTWSDGSETVEAMAEAARELGYEYIAICDHSVSSKIANGLSVERLLRQLEQVKEINERTSGIEVLMGSEVDILRDGSLDYPDEILEKLDVVVASVHSGFNMDELAMTKRIISAIENRFVHIIGHPTGRLLGRRDPYRVNIDALIDAAAENNTALEINAYPDRLDLKDTHARRAKERGVMLAINTDAHNAADLALMIYGIYTARRGWLERKDVLNALPLAELTDWLRER
jgi:DNA polymerase (family 10)